MKTIERLESKVRSYSRGWPAVFTRSKGHRLWTEDGEEFIDFFAGAGSLNYGHNNDELKRALIEYLESDGVTHSLDMATSAREDFLEAFEEQVAAQSKSEVPFKWEPIEIESPRLEKLLEKLTPEGATTRFSNPDLSDEAVKGAIASKYRNTGQTCVCANRVFVQDGVYDAFAKKFADKVSTMKVGSGLEDGVVQGPLIDMKAVEKVEEHIADALGKGARVLIGGKRHALGGTFFEPTILADVNTQMKVTREETFGPVAPLYRFKTEQELLELANNTEYGLAAYFYSRDIGRVWRVAEGIEAGIIGINVGIISTEVAPFGGVKESGIGREGSKYGMEEFLEVKYLCLGDITK